jgi:hypothetical protein
MCAGICIAHAINDYRSRLLGNPHLSSSGSTKAQALMGAAPPEKVAGMMVQRIVDDAFRPGAPRPYGSLLPRPIKAGIFIPNRTSYQGRLDPYRLHPNSRLGLRRLAEPDAYCAVSFRFNFQRAKTV